MQKAHKASTTRQRCRCALPKMRSRFWVVMATHASTQWSAGTVTPRFWVSAILVWPNKCASFRRHNVIVSCKPIIMHQAIAFKLANMITQIDAARLLIWRASWLAKNGGYKNAEGSQSKYYASEMSVRVTEDAIQILGGYGYTREYPVERWHRDAKIHTIFEGTSEIQQLVISRAISGLRIE